MKAIDTDLVDLDGLRQDIDLDNVPKFKNFDISDESELRSVAASCYLNPNKIMIGQEREGFSKNARVFIDRDQPLISALTVKEEDIKKQEAKIKEMRKKLQLALKDYENLNFDYLDKIDMDSDAEALN